VPTEWREDRKKWGYRFYRQGKRYKKYAWDTEAEAAKAERLKLTELENNPPLPPTALGAAAAAYLTASAEPEIERSMWRLDGLRYTFKAHIIPHFGETRSLHDIGAGEARAFLRALKRKTQKSGKRLKNKTIKNIMTDFRALYNWAIAQKLTRENPVTAEVFSEIGSTKFLKAPLNPKDFARAFAVLDEYERAWWLTHECLGLRMDEGNRLLRTDPNFDTGLIHVPGTKTDEAECYMPMAPALQKELKAYLKMRKDDSPMLFPGRSAQTQGKKIYSRRRLFEKIRRVTAFKAYMRKHPDAAAMKVWKELKRAGYPGGVKLTPKDLRDYFGTVVAERVTDPNVLMRLMRHTSLTTTTKYMRVVEERMREAVASLGANAGGQSSAVWGPKSVEIGLQEKVAALTKLRLNMQNEREKSGGGGRSRTYDAADMSRVL
jgi:integrase